MRGRGAGDVVVVVDGSNHVLDDLNRRIQRERLVMEEIGARAARRCGRPTTTAAGRCTAATTWCSASGW